VESHKPFENYGHVIWHLFLQPFRRRISLCGMGNSSKPRGEDARRLASTGNGTAWAARRCSCRDAACGDCSLPCVKHGRLLLSVGEKQHHTCLASTLARIAACTSMRRSPRSSICSCSRLVAPCTRRTKLRKAPWLMHGGEIAAGTMRRTGAESGPHEHCSKASQPAASALHALFLTHTWGSCLMAASSASSSAWRRSRARLTTRLYSAAISPATSKFNVCAHLQRPRRHRGQTCC